MSRYTRQDRIKNECMRKKVGQHILQKSWQNFALGGCGGVDGGDIDGGDNDDVNGGDDDNISGSDSDNLNNLCQIQRMYFFNKKSNL